MSELQKKIREKIREIRDFPKPGIGFKDITPVLGDGSVFGELIAAFGERYGNKKIDVVVGVESRGFIFGAPAAYELGAAFVPVRKKGKLPHKTVAVEYSLEYGTDTVEVHQDAISQGKRVLVVDDLLATGGTAKATCELVEKVGGVVVECAFIVNLSFLHGREQLKNYEVFSFVDYT